MKRLYKSSHNRVFRGIIGGLGEYYDTDPTLMRLFWLFFVMITGFVPGVLLYLIAIALVPEREN